MNKFQLLSTMAMAMNNGDFIGHVPHLTGCAEDGQYYATKGNVARSKRSSHKRRNVRLHGRKGKSSPRKITYNPAAPCIPNIHNPVYSISATKRQRISFRI